jgi:hypothetical protein
MVISQGCNSSKVTRAALLRFDASQNQQGAVPAAIAGGRRRRQAGGMIVLFTDFGREGP